MFDLINEILATLRHNKVRTALTGFAVSWGIFLLIVLLSVSRGLQNGMESLFATRDTEVITVDGGWALKPYKGLKEERQVELKNRDIALLAQQNGSTVASVTAEISSDSSKVMSARDYLTDGYTGVYPAALKANALELEKGRFINDNDINAARRVVVIHRNSASTLFGDENPIGKQVKINDLSFTVVGIYYHEWERKSYIPYSTAHHLAGGDDTVNRILVKTKGLKTLQDGDAAEEGIRETLGRSHSFAKDDDSAVRIWNRFSERLRSSSAMDAVGLAVWVIGLLTMLSGIVGVSNIMFVSVRERTHEIGVRRAIGARPLTILKQIILESVAITTLFGYIGIVMGIGVAQVVEKLTESTAFIKNPSVDLSIAVEVTAVLIAAGALAGLFPALKSLKIKPVEALRDE